MRFTFRPLTPSDLPAVVRWQASPAAAPWFGGGLTLDAARARYLPRLTGPHPVRMVVLHWAGRDVGYAQAYRVGDLPAGDVVPAPPDHVGIDYVIGEPDLVGTGLGTRLIADLVELVPLLFPGATGVVASPPPPQRGLAAGPGEERFRARALVRPAAGRRVHRDPHRLHPPAARWLSLSKPFDKLRDRPAAGLASRGRG